MPRSGGRAALLLSMMANLAALAAIVVCPGRGASAAAANRAASSSVRIARRRPLSGSPAAAFTVVGGVAVDPRLGGGPTFVAPRGVGAVTSPPPRRFVPFRAMSQFLMTVDDDDAAFDSGGKTIESTWDIPGLKKEAARQTLRCHKKVGKASTRLRNAEAQVEDLLSNPVATPGELEACPNIEAMRAELDDLRSRLGKLNELEEKLRDIKKKKMVLPDEEASLAIELGVDDSPPKREPRGPQKKKGPKTVAPRMPYRKYYTKDNTEIRVGKQAPDNDELSINPTHRDADDWWMHASGCPGSHVVIRCHDQAVNEEVVKDAAALAARQSKCAGQVIKVSMVRCRQITKPKGAKAGLVQLNGSVRTVQVNMKEVESRLERLDGTMVLN